MLSSIVDLPSTWFTALSWAVGVLFLLYCLVPVFRLGIRSFCTPLNRLKGPPNPSWLTGVEWLLLENEDAVLTEQWTDSFGSTFKYPSFLGKWELCTVDPRAIGHVLSNSYMYPKPSVIRSSLAQILGEGLISAEGETHKRQRRILNPSFSPAQIREITPIFFDKASKMCDIWAALLLKSSDSSGTRLDVYQWLSRATLDIIGLAGFGYSFDSLVHDDNELATAFRELFRVQLQIRVINLLRTWFAALRFLIPEPDKKLKQKSMATMRRVGLELIHKKKAEALHVKDKEDKGTGVNKSSLGGRDLLSAMIRANMADDLSPSHRLSDEEVLSQITTFILAGHETTSNGVTWALLALSQNLRIQTKLREEVLSVIENCPSMDDLNSLSYLDLVVREVLRLHAPVRDTVRVAMQDDSIPLSYPILDEKGISLDTVRVQEGDAVVVPILAMNRSKLLWGENAHDFVPERFQELPSEAAAIPGAFSNMMTFLGGPRACIGYRFSVIEMKVFLFTLVRAFIFEPADPSIVIEKKSAIVTRPVIRGQEEKGAQLPLLVRPVVR